jgi:two-component system sensor histidine kinase PilS (NtrC family)
MSRTEAARQLRWLMILRVVTVTTLLVSAFAIELLLMPAETLRPLFMVAAVAYGFALVWAALYRWLGHSTALVYAQLVGDALVVTGFVAITGGLDSPMSFLYLLPICVASLMLYGRGGLTLAGVSWLLYVGLVTVGPLLARRLEWLSTQEAAAIWLEREPSRVSYSLVVHLVGMAAVAILSSYLSERLRSQARELAQRKGTVERLQVLTKNIIESINSGLVTTDAAGRIGFINRGGSEITGYPAEEVVGRSVEELFGMEPGSLREIGQQLHAERRFRLERYFESKSGGTIFLGIAVSNLYDRSGRSLGYIFIFQDLTDIHALEQEIRLKERMAALGEMAAGMAHELRNPLAAISGSVQYLKGALQLEGETLELMDIILRESQRLDQAIRDFLTFARPGGFDPERSDLVKLIEDSLKLLRKSRQFRSRHRVETRYAASQIWCEVDQNRMKQVFWNLANNALKAMPDGGTLTIEVGWGPGGERAEIRFIDDGRGMSEAERERYFQPFSGTFEDGSGLGAAIVYRLVEEHGGRISLDSEPGQGTRVRVELPRRQSVRSEPSPWAVAQAAGG